MKKREFIPILLIILTISSMAFDSSKDIGTYCFESPYIFIDESTKVKKVVIHFEDFNHSREGGSTLRMFYILENDNRRYKIPDLYMYYNKQSNIYHGGVERDGGGELEFDITHNRLYMNDILLYGATIDIMPVFEFESPVVQLDDSLENIVPLSDVLHGTISTGFLDKNKRINSIGKKFWITGKKCTDSKDLKGSKIFYTEKEYIEAFKNAKKEDEYLHLFNEPFVERKELDAKIETIKLKKSYSNIADMMSAEGFDFEWIKSYTIKFFLHNNKRAFIRVSHEIPDNVKSGCFCGGYYLLELHQNILNKMDFGWECGSMVVPQFYNKEILVEEKK